MARMAATLDASGLIPRGGHSVAQESHRRAAKNTLFAVDVEVRSTQSLQKNPLVGDMGGPVWTREENVVEVDEDKR